MVKTSLFLKYYSSEHIFHPLLYFSLVQGRMGRVFPINFYDVCQHLLNTFITNRVVFSRESDSRIAIVLGGCGYVKSRMWLCAK